MQNFKTVAVTSALLGGMATFVLSTWQPPQFQREPQREAPARLPQLAAEPIFTPRPLEIPPQPTTVLAAHTTTALTPPAVLIPMVATEAAPAPVPGTPATAPTITSIKELPTDFRTKASKIVLNVTFAEAQVPKGSLTAQIGKDGVIREARAPITGGTQTQEVAFEFPILEMKSADEIRLQWDPDGDGVGQKRSPASEPKTIWIDNVPPQVMSVRLTGETGGVAILEVQFANGDLKTELIRDTVGKASGNVRVQRTAGQHTFGTAHESISMLDHVPGSSVIRLNLGSLHTDLYEVEFKEQITDQHGNPLAEPRKFTFNSLPEAPSGKHVEFPEFVRRKERSPTDVFNPGDKVETRVARLFYMRDAHRVAQIINRGTKSLNQSGVDRAKLTATSAREAAEKAAHDRQIKERDAIRAAESNRQLERELAGARRELEEMRAVMSQRDLNTNVGKKKVNDLAVAEKQRILAEKNADADALQKNLKTLVGQISDQQKTSEDSELDIQEVKYRLGQTSANNANYPSLVDELKKHEETKTVADQKLITLKERKAALVTQLAAARAAQLTAQKELAEEEAKNNPLAITANSTDSILSAVRATASKVAELERTVADKRQVENIKRESAEQAQETEDRARENQFRAEVAAGTEDPDTYVPGDVNSQDPVTQVSVSVIGEGVLQLRGPIRGINKIRTIINQMDMPLGQVKVGIFTVQVNGEHGDRMEKVASRIEGHIDLSRFLTNQSLGYLRRAIQEVAGNVVTIMDSQQPNQHRQMDRDRKYLYGFFGRDFVDELYEMDSEFLRTENKLLSLHGMDTVSLSQACFIMALCKNDIRQQIQQQFRYLIECEMPLAEWDYRRTSKLLPCKLNSQKEVCRNAFEKYKFRNLHGFFEANVTTPDAMTPMQREFIRLAQIFKSQMVAEMELKQRVIERGLIEDASNSEVERAKILETVRHRALEQLRTAFDSLVDSNDRLLEVTTKMALLEGLIQEHSGYVSDAVQVLRVISATNRKSLANQARLFFQLSDEQKAASVDLSKYGSAVSSLRQLESLVANAEHSKLLRPITKSRIRDAWEDVRSGANEDSVEELILEKGEYVRRELEKDNGFAETMRRKLADFRGALEEPSTPYKLTEQYYLALLREWQTYETRLPDYLSNLRDVCNSAFSVIKQRELRIRHADYITNRVRRDLDHRKLLELLIDEQEEKCIELAEGTRSHIAQIDNYLKRLAIALEDDFKVQFYDPAFAGVRAASREWDVNLGQVERTTILTNNRQFAKVSPQATMEFDLPKRAPMIVEGMNGARAMVQEYGTLLQDPTFLSLAGMMSGSPTSAAASAGNPVPGLPNQGLRSAAVRNVLPGQSTDAGEQLMSQTGGPDRQFGAALEGLIPDPAVYKFETGTGFEIRPVIQPDGHSVIYDFDYMYTTNVREPVRPDEKHLGRVKRHFIHTQVQTSSFELREISRYQVALKASRTSRGVPLLEDIPGAGVLFRPLPSDESSLQQNIILGQSTVYPTLFDLMGLRWSKYVAELSHVGLRDLDHVTRGREHSIHDFTFDEASHRVDEFLDIRGKHDEHLRPDLYHQQRIPSPYHPGGYHYETEPPMTDPNNRNFTIPDRRPEEFREPAYDTLRRNRIDDELRQYPNPGGIPETVDPRLQPPENIPPLPSTSKTPRTPSNVGQPAASRKVTSSPTTSQNPIQPVSYEQAADAPKVFDNVAGHARSASVPTEPKSPTFAKRKLWIGKP